MGFQFPSIVNFFKRVQRMETSGAIHSSDAFRTILERETARSERTGQIFSLVIFGINSGNGTDSAILESLCNNIKKKIRKSDEIGWYDGNRIGTILTGTPAEGAYRFVEIVKKRNEEIKANLLYSVYSYPSSGVHSENSREFFKDPKSTGTGFSSAKCSAESLEVLLAQPIPIWKRVVDICGAILFLILLSPVFLLTALYIKIVSPGPVFYRQERIGYLGRKFKLWKFRTMHVNSNTEKHRQYLIQLIENDKPMTKLDDKKDKRIIPFAKFLRTTCLDELPQLINVLKGDMSLVGPRPCLPYESEEFLQWHMRRLDIVPGMTGLWQVSGKNQTTFKDMIRFDIRYRRKMSPLLDAKIILLTGPAIVEMVGETFAEKVGTRQERGGFTPSRRDEFARRLKP